MNAYIYLTQINLTPSAICLCLIPSFYTFPTIVQQIPMTCNDNHTHSILEYSITVHFKTHIWKLVCEI